MITLTRQPLSVSRALHVLNSCVLTWRRLPLICLKLLVGVCVRGGPAASVCVYRTSAASVESSGLARRRFPLLASLSKRFGVAHGHSHCSLLLWRLVCTRQACCLLAHVALLLLRLNLFLGVRAPTLSLCGFRF